MSTVAIIDYKLCNVHSVKAAVEKCGAQALITDQAEEIEAASHIILPGVGSFADAMRNLHDQDLVDIIRTQVSRNVPFLGICLGMQLMATRGEEGGDTEGLGLIEGNVVRLKAKDPKERIPHIGWNEVHIVKDSPLMKEIPNDRDFYFVHGYHLKTKNADDVVATTPYCGSFAAVVSHGNIWGTQFHPEKSQKLGLQLLKNFLTL